MLFSLAVQAFKVQGKDPKQKIHIGHVRCPQGADDLNRCEYRWGNAQCDHSSDVAVTCGMQTEKGKTIFKISMLIRTCTICLI